MRTLLFFSILLMTAPLLASNNKVLVTGSSTLAPIMQDIALAFEKDRSLANIEVQTGGSTKGIIDVRKKLSDFGMVSRALKAKERDLHHKVIAYDGLGIITHASNPIKNITKQQLIDIYTRKITNWQEIGGNNKAIVIVHKAEGRSTLELFLKFTSLRNSQIKPHIIIGDNQQGIKTVVGSENAISYVSVGAASYTIKTGSKINLLSLDGLEATPENIKSKKYPILRSLVLVYKGPPSPLARDLAAYATSSKVTNILKKHYVIKP